jgi:predicted glycosyltransferase
VFGVERPRSYAADGRLRVLLIAPKLTEAPALGGLQALALSRKLSVTILTDGKSKTALRTAGLPVAIYQYGEVPLWTLGVRTNVAVFCDPVPKSYAIRMLLADMSVSGVGLLDASEGFVNRRLDPSFVPAPADPSALATFLVNEIMPQLGELNTLSRSSATARKSRETLAALRAALGENFPSPVRAVSRVASAMVPPRIVFMPTNGVGLGHAQRCALVAAEMAPPTATPVFAAFPSCMRLIKNYGFDVMPLVQKSALHAEGLANDVVNYRRLHQLLSTAAGLVFDGGYVFNSVFRSILEHRVPSVWIRRGLWQAGQDNSIALEREKVFDHVIVPLEAFDELNQDYSAGRHVTKVGPIVQQVSLTNVEHETIRKRLAGKFGVSFRHLVVTMLGGGVAADRSAQAISVAASVARRSDTLNLVVVWPTAKVDAGLFGWPNTRVVRTHHASVLAAVADLYVSAVGYNSFHEAIYNRIPTIFIPQMAAFMDDQRARGAAAAERGLARLIEPHQLMSLDHAISGMLDGEGEEIRARLAATQLPVSGSAVAADVISEVADLNEAIGLGIDDRRIA